MVDWSVGMVRWLRNVWIGFYCYFPFLFLMVTEGKKKRIKEFRKRLNIEDFFSCEKVSFSFLLG